MNSVNRNDIVLFVKGKDDKPIAYADNGKVILCKHSIDCRYVRITSVEEKPTVVLVTAENEYAYDYYDGISYEEFKEMIEHKGFNIEFERPFDYTPREGEATRKEMQLYAWNPDNNCVIVANTYNNRETLCSIELYCPGVDIWETRGLKGSYAGTSNFSIFELTRNHSIGCNRALDTYMRITRDFQQEKGKEWPDTESPNMWTYADKAEDFENKDGSWGLGINTLSRLSAASKEATDIFKHCIAYKHIFK